ncbi:hypothetical protein JYK22_03730, partial [Nonomuraea sp. RK-328]|nr:hypothetical protein [Nonomuraea sp. RK-328]
VLEHLPLLFSVTFESSIFDERLHGDAPVQAIKQAPEIEELAYDAMSLMKSKGWRIGPHGSGIWEDTDNLLRLWIAFTSPDFHFVEQDPDDLESDYRPELEAFAEEVQALITARTWTGFDYAFAYYDDRPPEFMRIE